MLTIVRWCYVILGIIGLAPTAILLNVNWDIMQHARRQAERYMAKGFFIYSVALAMLLVGQSGLALWQISGQRECSLWPAVVQIAWLFVTDVALVTMCWFSLFVELDRRKNRGN